MAVGVIVGAAFQGIVNSLVNDVISPLLGLDCQHGSELSGAYGAGVDIKYGSFLTAVINSDHGLCHFPAGEVHQ